MIGCPFSGRSRGGALTNEPTRRREGSRAALEERLRELEAQLRRQGE
jgi:hypothetical protein